MHTTHSCRVTAETSTGIACAEYTCRPADVAVIEHHEWQRAVGN